MLTLPSPTADTPSFERIDASLDQLKADTPGRWGVMDAPAMVEHCRRFTDLYLGRVEVSTPIRWMARALGPMFLKRVLGGSPTKTPRNLRTLGSIKVTPGTQQDLADPIAALRSSLSEVEALKDPYRNPLYGSMDPESAKALVRHHTAHHLHQFGLLDS